MRTSEERIWASVAHLSALAFGMGIFLPIFGWSGQRRKSKYASLQCLQALGYQSLGYTIWVLIALVIVLVQSLNTFSEVLRAVGGDAEFEQLMSLAMGGHFLVMMRLLAGYMVLPFIGAIACAFGREFRYPILGRRLANYVGYDAADAEDWLTEEHEDRFVAAMGHFSVIVIFWGMLAPLTTWVSEGKRSPFLRNQSAQALAFQAGTILLYIAAGFLYGFGLLIFILTIGFEGDVAINSTSGMIGTIVFLLSLLMVLLIVLAVPLLHILGQWAGYRVLKGDDFRYPLIGKFLENKLK